MWEIGVMGRWIEDVSECVCGCVRVCECGDVWGHKVVWVGKDMWLSECVGL